MEFSWRWILRIPPEKLWPYVADTDRFNRFAKLPPVTQKEIPGPLPKHQVSTRVKGFTLTWEEEPFEFERPHGFSVKRDFTKGPLSEFKVRVQLNKNPVGTELVYEVQAVPRFWFYKPLVWIQLRVFTQRTLQRVFPVIEAALLRNEEPYLKPPVALEKSLSGPFEKLMDGVADAAIFIKYLLEASEEELFRIRPFEAARKMGVGRDLMLTLCLEAAKRGILEAQWSIVCPHCRGSKSESAELKTLDLSGHCDSCNVDFEGDFSKLTEMVFKILPRWKVLSLEQFCVGSPKKIEHVQLQFILGPGLKTEKSLNLRDGGYWIKSSSGGLSAALLVSADGLAQGALKLKGQPLNEPLNFSTGARLFLENQGLEPALITVEECEWIRDFCSAAKVASFQRFRDLFGADVLANGIEVSVSQVTILFTDLKDSTATYNRIGDASAFGLVRDHFDVIKRVLTENRGALVKTIGDAVMASFHEPLDAVRAAFQMHRAVEGLRASDQSPVVLKIGVHTGPALVVTQNDVLDYFGATVNLAARIQNLALGGDVILDKALAADPEIQAFLGDYSVEPFEAELKGFSGKREVIRAWAPVPQPEFELEPPVVEVLPDAEAAVDTGAAETVAPSAT